VEKENPWCTLGRSSIIVPYWFKHADERPETVDAERYMEPMRRKFMPALKGRQRVEMDIVIYQRDGATPHCSDRIRPPLLPWGQAHLSAYEQPLACTFSTPISFGLFSVGISQ